MRPLYLSILALTTCLAADQANIEGAWQVSWEVRLGTAHAILQLKQEGTKLSGTFQQTTVKSPVSGTVQGKSVTLEVAFAGPRPYTIEFIGTVDGGKISGKSRAKDVEGAGAYLGHGGEVVQPDHPWTATRPPEPKN